jgi:hypothetical protein
MERAGMGVVTGVSLNVDVSSMIEVPAEVEVSSATEDVSDAVEVSSGTDDVSVMDEVSSATDDVSVMDDVSTEDVPVAADEVSSSLA